MLATIKAEKPLIKNSRYNISTDAVLSAKNNDDNKKYALININAIITYVLILNILFSNNAIKSSIVKPAIGICELTNEAIGCKKPNWNIYIAII